MKIQGPGKTGSSSKTKKKDGAKAAEGFGEFVAAGASAGGGAAATQGSSNAGTTQSITQVDALLAIQAAEDPTERAARKRAHHRADTILEELDGIRMAMLGGDLTIGHMVNIADVVASHRDRVQDPAMTALMDEIDLRAQVELAKMRVALDGRQKGDD